MPGLPGPERQAADLLTRLRRSGIFVDVKSRPGPRDLRASDADRELVITLLGDAAADGRLTLAEHAQRTEQALNARTLGDLAVLTTDLTPASGQPIQLYPGRSVSAICSRDRRAGRWVVPDTFAVTAVFGDVEVDLREAIMQSRQTTLFATAVCGQIRLVVPAGVAVTMSGRSFLGVRSVRGPVVAAPAGAGSTSIDVRALTLGGMVKVVAPRRSRWRPALRGRQ